MSISTVARRARRASLLWPRVISTATRSVDPSEMCAKLIGAEAEAHLARRCSAARIDTPEPELTAAIRSEEEVATVG